MAFGEQCAFRVDAQGAGMCFMFRMHPFGSQSRIHSHARALAGAGSGLPVRPVLELALAGASSTAG